MGQMSPAPVPHPHTSGSPLPAATDTLRAVSSMTHCTQEILWSSSGHQMGSKAPTALLQLLSHISLLAGYTTSQTQLSLPCSELSQTTSPCLHHSPSHKPAAFVGFLGGYWWGAAGQPDGDKAIPTSGTLHKAQQPHVLCSPLGAVRRYPQGESLQPRGAQGLPRKRQG